MNTMFRMVAIAVAVCIAIKCTLMLAWIWIVYMCWIPASLVCSILIHGASFDDFMEVASKPLQDLKRITEMYPKTVSETFALSMSVTIEEVADGNG